MPGVQRHLDGLRVELGTGKIGEAFAWRILNVGGVAGLVLGGFVADRRGIKLTTLGWFAVSVAMPACLSIRMHSDLLLDTVVFLTGVFVFTPRCWSTRT